MQNKAVGKDAGTVAGAGALTGAAWGLSCGFFALVCSPIGALAGAIVGGSSGAIVGSTRGLKKEQIDSVSENVLAFTELHDPQTEMLATLSTLTADKWTVLPAPAQKDITVVLKKLGLATRGKGDVVLVMEVEVTIQWLNKANRSMLKTKIFEYQSSPTYVETWIDGKQDFLQLQFESAYRTLAENILIALSALGRPT